MKKLTIESLNKIKAETVKSCENCIKVGLSTCGIAAGAEDVFKTFTEEINKRNLSISVKKCGCIGMCYAEPLVEVNINGLPRVLYGKVNKKIAIKIIEEHIQNKKLVQDYIYEINV